MQLKTGGHLCEGALYYGDSARMGLISWGRSVQVRQMNGSIYVCKVPWMKKSGEILKVVTRDI